MLAQNECYVVIILLHHYLFFVCICVAIKVISGTLFSPFHFLFCIFFNFHSLCFFFCEWHNLKRVLRRLREWDEDEKQLSLILSSIQSWSRDENRIKKSRIFLWLLIHTAIHSLLSHFKHFLFSSFNRNSIVQSQCEQCYPKIKLN